MMDRYYIPLNKEHWAAYRSSTPKEEKEEQNTIIVHWLCITGSARHNLQYVSGRPRVLLLRPSKTAGWCANVMGLYQHVSIELDWLTSIISGISGLGLLLVSSPFPKVRHLSTYISTLLITSIMTCIRMQTSLEPCVSRATPRSTKSGRVVGISWVTS